MIVKYYVIYDKVSKLYGDIFPSANDAFVIREINQMIKDKRIQHVQDKQVYRCYEFDNESGVITHYPDLELIHEFKEQSNE